MKEKERMLFISSPDLFAIAKAARNRTVRRSGFADGDRLKRNHDTLVAVIFSVVTLEAYINELGAIADSPLWSSVEDPWIRSFVSVMKELERKKESTELKYRLAKIVFSGTPYDEDKLPFQDFRLLVGLRNMIVHSRPQEEAEVVGSSLRAKPPKIIAKLRSKHIVHDPGKSAVPWMNRISTPETAQWACNTAASMSRSIYEAIPEGKFKNSMRPGIQLLLGEVDMKEWGRMGKER